MNRRLEQIKQLLRTGFFHIFGSSVVNKIVGFLSSIVLVRILTKSEYGVFTYAWNIYSIVLIFNGFGMEHGVLQVCSELRGEVSGTGHIVGYGLRFGIFFDLILAAVLVGIGTWVPMPIEGSGALLRALCLLPLLQFAFQLFTAHLRSQKLNQLFSKVTVTNTILVFLGVSSCSWLFRERGMVLGYYLAYGTSLALCARQLYAASRMNGNTMPPDDKKALLSIAAVSMCNNGLSHLMYLLDVFVLGLVDPQETVLASYKTATIIPSALVFIPLSLITYLYPYFAEHRHDGAWCIKHYKLALVGLGIVNALISTFLVIFAPWIIRLLFGEAYLDAVPVFRILSVNYFFSGTFRILSGNLLVTQRKLKFNFFVALFSGCVNIIANFIFIRRWGSLGAAYATVLVVTLTSILNTVYLIHTFRKNRNNQ